jgi:hypothetical protein
MIYTIEDFIASLIEILYAEYSPDEFIINFLEIELDSWERSAYEVLDFVENLKFSISLNEQFDEEERNILFEAIDSVF